MGSSVCPTRRARHGRSRPPAARSTEVMQPRHRAALALVGAMLLASAVGLAPSSEAQVPPLVSTTTTTTTAPPGSTSTTAPPSGDDFSNGASEAPAGAADVQGDGTAAPSGGIAVPPAAQRII